MSGIAEVSPNYLAEMASNAIALEYKQTEVGMIPEDWEVKSIGEISSVFSGGTPNRKIPEYWDGDIPWVTTTLIDGAEISTAKEFITQRGLENSSTKWCKAGTILLAMYGQGKTRGKAAILSIDATINQACAAIELKDVNSSHYVLHILNSMYEEIRELSNSGGQENLSGGIIKSIQIPVPPKSEQTAIANALSDVDALISELEKLIAKKQAIKTATMQQLLTGRTRLPQFALREDGTPKSTKPSELGEVPEDWGVVTLAHLATVKSGGTPSTLNKDFWDGEIHWCTPTDITALDGKKYLATTTRKITEAGVAKSAADLLPVGTVVMTSRATIGECAVTTSEMTTNQGFKNFICGPELDNEFLFYLLGSLKDRFLALCSGSTFLEISTSQVRNFSVVAPDKSEQTAIATILSDMDADIQALEQRLGKTRQIKQGMMQELLTGKTRLIKPSKEVIHE
jgi:type I restriction enzyme, S subunit